MTIISQNLIISNEDILDIQSKYGFTKYNITFSVLLVFYFIFTYILGPLLVFFPIALIYFYFVRYKNPKNIDVGLYSIQFHLTDKTISLNTVTFEFFKGSFLLPFCAFAKSQQSKHFILLQQKTVTYPEWIFLKKDAITYADFQRLQKAIPCLQGLSVDPQQFKQEALSNE